MLYSAINKLKEENFGRFFEVGSTARGEENPKDYDVIIVPTLKNKEKWSAYAKDYYKQYIDNKKDGYHRVYLLEDYNYVGVTNSLYYRFNQHKSVHNRDCTNHRILYKTKDRGEALELEALLHDMGYEGKKEA